MTIFIIILLIIISYLFGSVPNGLIIGKVFKNIDIRNEGSKNIGATNTMRVLGWKFGLLALVLDALKGVMVILAIGITQAHDLYIVNVGSYPLNILGIYGLAGVLGHIFPIFLKFKGGKAVATSYGVALALVPTAALVGSLVFVLLVKKTKFVSLGSIFGALVVLVISILGVIFKDFGRIVTWTVELPLEYLVILLLLGFIILFRHKTNIDRLSNGTENKIEI